LTIFDELYYYTLKDTVNKHLLTFTILTIIKGYIT